VLRSGQRSVREQSIRLAKAFGRESSSLAPREDRCRARGAS